MPADFVPSRESDLVTFSTNFNTRIAVDFAAVGLTNAQATAYAALHNAFVAAYNLVNGGSNSTPNVVTKNQAKVNLISGTGGIRDLVNIIQAFPGTTNTQRAELLITIPDVEPTSIPAPTQAPSIVNVRVTGKMVSGRLRDSVDPDNRGRPAGVAGASIFSYVGTSAPESLSQWKFEGNTTRTDFLVQFPITVDAGAQVWISAYWRNPTDESGPMAAPYAATLAGGLPQAA